MVKMVFCPIAMLMMEEQNGDSINPLNFILNYIVIINFSQQYWSDFVKIVELCRQNKIDLKVFISPAHATQWESIKGNW